MRFSNPTQNTLRFHAAGAAFEVEPGAECAIPDASAFVVKAYGLPLVAIAAPLPAAVATVPEDAPPAAPAVKVGDVLICEDLAGVSMTGEVIDVNPRGVLLELEDERRWPVRLESITDGTWTHEPGDYPPGFLGLDAAGAALFEAAPAPPEAPTAPEAPAPEAPTEPTADAKASDEPPPAAPAEPPTPEGETKKTKGGKGR
jgi:hypothetical protein